MCVEESLPDAAAVLEATLCLGSTGPEWSELIDRIGPCGWTVNTTREPFEALVRSIAFQQVHARAAEAILGRFLDLYPGTAFPHPDTILASESALLRGVGFSGSKILAIRAIAAAAANGIVPTRKEAAGLDDAALIERLVTIRGVGRWTVEMLLMFTLGRPDVLPVDDFGVREGWRVLYGLSRQPNPKDLAEAGRSLSPWRTVASWYLWRAADAARMRKLAEAPITGFQSPM